MNEHLLKQFKLSESEVSKIQSTLPSGQTLLDVLFEKHLIDPNEYIQWAKNHYSLPLLKTEFLNKTNNVEALLGQYQNVFPKNIIPFHEMDGVLYVMCLEPTPFEAPQAIQYVLAPYEVISKYAAKIIAKKMPPQEAEPILVKENTNPLFKNLEQSNDKKSDALEGFNFDNLAIAPQETSAPQGISDQLEGLDSPSAEGEIPEVNLEEKKDIPAGLNFPPNPSSESTESFVTDQPVTSVDLASFKFEGLMPAKEDYKPPTGEKAPSKLTTMTADSLVAKNPPKKSGTQTTNAQTPPKPVTATPVTPVSTASVAETPVAAPEVSAVPVAKAKASVGVGDQQFDEILTMMKKYFEQSMVLLFKDGLLEPQAWDSTWVKNAHTQSVIDVSTPSIFRIVNETQQPYHGHIVPNPINESFFNNWNKGTYPQHITICPIIHQRKIFGMILGATTKEGAKKYQLHHIQEIANDTFALISSKKAA